jgi:hypothetical protein
MAVGKEAQLCQQFSLPTTWAEAVGKAGRVLQGKPSFANSLAQSCWQSWEFFPLFFCSFLAFNSHIKSTHQYMNQNTTYISTI